MSNASGLEKQALRRTTGLYHTAILYPTRRLLADALRRLIVAKIPLEGASDHGVSEALYLRDPDDNRLEFYWDRPKEMCRGSRTAACGCSPIGSTCTICWANWTGGLRLRRQICLT